MTTDEPNPNWKIDKAIRTLNGIRKYNFKVMWRNRPTLTWSPAINSSYKPLMARVFKNEESARAFYAKKLMFGDGLDWVGFFKKAGDRWEKYDDR